MLEIIIILIVIGIIGNIIIWIKNHFETILGLIGILIGIAAIIGVGIIAIPVILPFLPYVLLVGIPCIIIYRIVMKIRSNSYIRWINCYGVAPQSFAPGSNSVWKWAEKRKYTITLEFGYIMSTQFCDMVLYTVNQQNIVTETALVNDCLQAAPYFHPEDISVFLNYLIDYNLLLEVNTPGTGTVYLSERVIKGCERQFELEGAATKDEFSIICYGFLQDASVAINSKVVAGALLHHFVSQGSAKIVELEDMGDDLFVSNRNISGSKMTRREISLD